jgi:threonine/homoserine/homoserine lactone efflux protein
MLDHRVQRGLDRSTGAIMVAIGLRLATESR